MSPSSQLTGFLIGWAILAIPGIGLAASSDDYESPIGRIDAQIACVPDQPQSSAADAVEKEEAACLAKFRGLVTRSGDDLFFRLDNGQTKKVRSIRRACRQIPVGDCIVYRLAGYIASSRQFVLRVSAYESVAAGLVGRRTGQVTELEGFPHVSPGGRHFVTVAASDAWAINNPITIYANTDPPKLIWRFPEPREYEQYGFDGWDGEDRIRLHTWTKPRMDTDVRRTADGWVLRRPNGKTSSGINGG